MKTAKEVCKELGIKYYKLDCLIRNGYVPEPMKIASGQRVFEEQDVRKIKEVLFERAK